MKIKHITQIFILIAAMMLFTAPSYAAYDPSLVGYWKLDETAGGTAYDSTTNDNDGTITGDPTLGATGQYGTAYSFNGSSDYIDLVSCPTLDLTGDFSVALWMKIVNTPTEQKWLVDIRRTTTGGNTYGYDFMFTQYRYMRLRFGTGTDTYYQAYSSSVVPQDEWHHVVGVRDGDQLVIYIDGSFDNSETASDSSIVYDDSCPDRRIATRWYLSNGYFEGDLDEVAIWDKALNGEQIANLYSWGVEEFEASGQVPEPSSMLFTLAGLGFAVRRKRRRL